MLTVHAFGSAAFVTWLVSPGMSDMMLTIVGVALIVCFWLASGFALGFALPTKAQ